MLPITYLPGSRLDFDEAFDWYASRSVIAAERFTNAIDAALLRISQNPQMHAYVNDVHQACLVKRFPFQVVFRQFEDQILIVAIAHAKDVPTIGDAGGKAEQRLAPPRVAGLVIR